MPLLWGEFGPCTIINQVWGKPSPQSECNWSMLPIIGSDVCDLQHFMNSAADGRGPGSRQEQTGYGRLALWQGQPQLWFGCYSARPPTAPAACLPDRTAIAALMKSGGKHECRLSGDRNIWETQKKRHDGNGAKFFCLLLFNKKREKREEREPLIKCTSKHFAIFLRF